MDKEMVFTFDVKSCNMGHSAGKKSGSIDLGTEISPIEVRPENILDIMVDMQTVSEEDREWFGVSNPTVNFYLFRHEVDERGEERTVMVRLRNPLKL